VLGRTAALAASWPYAIRKVDRNKRCSLLFY
jgi:hypothetical protein